jgi:AraC-like DNA-binding protein
MHDRSSKSSLVPTDPLTDMLKGLRLDGVEYGRCALAAPWAFSFPAQRDARFYFVAEEGCWLLPPSGEWMKLGAGDAVLLPRGGAHALASEPGLALDPFPRCECKAICDNIFDFQSDGGGAGCLLFFGSMRFNLDSLHPVLRMMPDAMRANELMRSEPAIPHLLDAMACEVAMNRVGSGGIVARLADVLAAQIIRSWVEHGCGNAVGWIAAVRNPEIGRVLAAIHASPDRDWPVSELARLMGASRSSFASKFAAIVGETPAHYVAQVRMHQARQWILNDRARISDVAQRLGYDSEASFSRAFKRIVGAAPSHFRARAD